MRKGSLLGFANIELPSGMILFDVTIYRVGGRQMRSPPQSLRPSVGGNHLLGPVGAAVGAVIGASPTALRAVANARAAGMANVHDIVRAAMLNPALARMLLSRPTPKTMPNVATALAATLGRASSQPDSRSTEAQRQTEGARHPGVKIRIFACLK